MYDVIVKDEEFESSSATIKTACGKIDELIEKYIEIMTKAIQQGFVSGESADALSVYVEQANQLRNAMSCFALNHETVKNLFLNEIDEADSYLY